MSEGKPLLPEGSPFELWDVRLKSGDVKLSIDELDAAFESGLVDRNTLVRRRGTLRWETLATAANLDPSDEPPAPTAPTAPTPRPAVPRPSTASAPPAARRTSPPPLPPSVAAPAPSVSPAAPPPLPPLPPLTVVVEPEPSPHVSSLPPPMTVSMAPSMAVEDLRSKEDAFSPLEDTAAAMAALRPRSNRRRLFTAFFLLTVIGAGTATLMKFPSVGHAIATAVHLKSSPPSAPSGVAAAAPPPAASTALPAPSAAPSSTPAPSSAPPEPVKTHPPAVSSAAKKPSRTTTKSGASPARH